MNEKALNQARDASRELEEAEAQLNKDSKSQNFWGVMLIAIMLVGCLGFVVGALWVANTIGVQLKVTMDGTHEEDR